MLSYRSLASIPFGLLVLVLTTLPSRSLAGNTDKCYQPNGAEVTETGGSLQIPLHACPPASDGFATCCAEGDTCSPDRLCYNAGGGNVWRNFCTDSTWKSISCSPLCRGTTEYDAGPVQITPCQDGTMCCGQNNTQCCSNHQGNYAFVGVPINSTSSQSSSNHLSGGSIAGIVIGAVAVVVLIALSILLLIKIRDDRRQRRFEGKAAHDVREHRAQDRAVSPISVPSPSQQQTVPAVRHQQDAATSMAPKYPSQAHELGDGQGVSRFEAVGNSVFLPEKK